MEVLVYGAGGVGLGLGSFLLEAGVGVCFVGRPATAEALRAHGLERSGLFGSHHAAPVQLRACEGLAALPHPAPFDYVLVTTKSGDSAAAARDLAAHAAQLGEATIVLCQNGWGNAERFADQIPAKRIYNARVITGFLRDPAHHVRVTAHAEPIAIGSLCGETTSRVAPLCAALAKGGLPAETTDRIAEVLWEKMLYNGCLNPLGAITGVAYGALGESAHGRAIIADLAVEIFRTMDAAGYTTRWPDAEAFLTSLYDELLPPTGAHESSTLQDLRAGKPTEIDALNGAVVALAEQHGVEVPVNRTIVAMVRFLEGLR